MISLGLIGCGAVAHMNYAKTLVGRDEYRVRYVCDTDPAQAASAAVLFDAEVVPHDILVDRADAIIISTPPSTHSSLVRECLRPGRTILCEKPFVTTFQDASDVYKLSQARDSGVYVGHFRRLFPQLALARELVGLGVIGEVTSLSASEGGRFTWRAVSSYTTVDSHGGVLWDTGSHTLDMALYASRLDGCQAPDIQDIRVERDKAEPSHAFRANFVVSAAQQTVDCRLSLSRKSALPNLIQIRGNRGRLVFVTGLDDRVRLATPTGTTVLRAQRSYIELMQCVDLHLRRVLTGRDSEPFAIENFVGQIKILETLANA